MVTICLVRDVDSHPITNTELFNLVKGENFRRESDTGNYIYPAFPKYLQLSIPCI